MFTTNFVDAVNLVSRAIYPEDIFSHSESPPKVVFRLLRKVLHEDFAPPKSKAEANEAFSILHVAWEIAEEMLADKSFGAKTKRIQTHVDAQSGASFFVKSKKGTYGDLVAIMEGSVSHVYLGTDKDGRKVAVKIATNPDCNQYLENEATQLRNLRSEFPATESGKYFPTLVDNFFIMSAGDKLAVNVTECCDGYTPLSRILELFQVAGKQIEVRAAAWMYNRILEALAHAHPLGIVHGGVHPDNILVHPESHRIVLTGWTSSVRAPERVPYACAPHISLYPNEVVGDKAKRKSALSTDLYMAAGCITLVLGGNVEQKTFPPSVPHEIRAFLSARLIADVGLRDAIAIAQRDRFGEVLKGLYGPPKFLPFVLPNTRS